MDKIAERAEMTPGACLFWQLGSIHDFVSCIATETSPEKSWIANFYPYFLMNNSELRIKRLIFFFFKQK